MTIVPKVWLAHLALIAVSCAVEPPIAEHADPARASGGEQTLDVTLGPNTASPTELTRSYVSGLRQVYRPERTALDAARVLWLRRGAALGSCRLHLQRLSRWEFQVSCGRIATYVQCGSGSTGTCCTTAPVRQPASSPFHLTRLSRFFEAKVCE
mgnify:CR=1 FL=1